MERKITITKTPKDKNSSYVEGTMAERIGYVWPLTAEVCALGKKYNAEQRLQRHIVRAVRRKS